MKSPLSPFEEKAGFFLAELGSFYPSIGDHFRCDNTPVLRLVCGIVDNFIL
jgi:hypothetical protein